MAKKDDRKGMGKNTLTREIVTFNIFLNALFLIFVLAGAIFLYYITLTNAKIDNAKFQSQIVTSSFNDILYSVRTEGHELSQDDDIINYLKYVNQGNDPIVSEGDPNHDIYSNFLIQTDSIVNYQVDGLYDLVYVATTSNCSVGNDGCAIAYSGELSGDTWNLTERPWYLELNGKESIITKPYIDELTGEFVISYIEKVYDGNDFLGYVGIDIKLENLGNIFSNIHSHKLSDSNEIIVFSEINTDPKLMFCTSDYFEDYYMLDRSDYLATDQSNEYKYDGLEYVVNSYNTEETTVKDVFNDEFMISYADIDGTNFTIVTLFYYQNLFRIETVFLFLFGIALIIIFLIGWILVKSTNKTLAPLDDITEAIDEIKKTNYDIHINVDAENELGKIANAINIMAEEIDFQIRRTYESLAYDLITGLKNRASATEEIENSVLKSNKRVAICLIKVENIRNINVTKGRIIGNDLIREIAQKLKSLLQEGETIFSNNNEFVLIKENINSLEQVEYVLNRIFLNFREPIQVKSIKTEVKFNIGVSIYPTDGDKLDELLKKCDTALFKFKDKKKRIVFYNDKIANSVNYHAEISDQLINAINNRQIYLKYQPLVTNKSELYGFEALARWNSPSLGEIGPQVFISNAEESQMIIPIGTWILEEACRAQVNLRKKYDREFVMSVNVSPVQILQKDFIDIVKTVIRKTDINPRYLTLEITESVFLEATIMIEDTIEQLHDMGVKLSLDDFGTGYASLTYLRQINFDNLKIDKTFVDGIFNSNKDHRIVGTIVSLVHNLNMKVIAEGVETKRQYEFLKQISTDIFQGYIFSKPLDYETLVKYIDEFYTVSKGKRLDYYSNIFEKGRK